MSQKLIYNPMKYDQVIRAHGLYLCGMSLAQVAARYGTTRQKLHYYFKTLKLGTRPLKRSDDVIEYNGDKYTPNREGYLRKTDGDRELLHRQVWKDHNGSIPQGMEIHHKNEDKRDCAIDNLEMISTSDHAKLHGFRNNQYTIKPDHQKHLDLACNNCWGDIPKTLNPARHNLRKFCTFDCLKQFTQQHGKSALKRIHPAIGGKNE